MKIFYFSFLFMFSVVFSQAQKINVPDSVFEHYRMLNEAETRLPEFKDSDLNLNLKVIQVAQINKSRKKHKAQPVQLDILASRVANKMCLEATELEYVGHWNIAGEKPYHRYAFAGGVDHIGENAYGIWSTGDLGTDSTSLVKLLKEGHASFMSEFPPKDGHKKNCIDKAHNFVGLGFYGTEHRLSYYEEFIDRYYEFENVPTRPLKTREKWELIVKCDLESELTSAVLNKELPIQKMKPKTIDRKESYLDGSTSSTLIDIPQPQIDPLDQSKKRYSIKLSFKQKGLYYLQIYHDRIENGKKVGKNISASGICIWVE